MRKQAKRNGPLRPVWTSEGYKTLDGIYEVLSDYLPVTDSGKGEPLDMTIIIHEWTKKGAENKLLNVRSADFEILKTY